MYAGMSPGAKAVTGRWSMFTQSGVAGNISCRLNACVGVRDDRPGVCVGGRFASEISSVEFVECSVDVVDVEQEARRDPVVCVDLDDAEHFTVKRLGSLISARQSESSEDKALATGCNDRRR